MKSFVLAYAPPILSLDSDDGELRVVDACVGVDIPTGGIVWNYGELTGIIV